MYSLEFAHFKNTINILRVTFHREKTKHFYERLCTSFEENTRVCERPDILASPSRPLISTELLLLAL